MRFDPLEVMGMWSMSPVMVIGDVIWPGPVVLALVKDGGRNSRPQVVVALQLAG
jgi:hypothetical protein